MHNDEVNDKFGFTGNDEFGFSFKNNNNNYLKVIALIKSFRVRFCFEYTAAIVKSMIFEMDVVTFSQIIFQFIVREVNIQRSTSLKITQYLTITH